MARHIAEQHFDGGPARPAVPPDGVAAYLAREAFEAPELWNQKGYLARVLTMDDAAPGGRRRRAAGGRGATTASCRWPTSPMPAAPTRPPSRSRATRLGVIRPALYIRRRGVVTEHLLDPHPLHAFASAEHRAAIVAALAGLGGAT